MTLRMFETQGGRVVYVNTDHVVAVISSPHNRDTCLIVTDNDSEGCVEIDQPASAVASYLQDGP